MVLSTFMICGDGRATTSQPGNWRSARCGVLQNAGFEPNVICVLHPDGLTRPDAYYEFCRDHSVTQISFSIDELEGANRSSSFSGARLQAGCDRFPGGDTRTGLRRRLSVARARGRTDRDDIDRKRGVAERTDRALGYDRSRSRRQRFHFLSGVYGGLCFRVSKFHISATFLKAAFRTSMRQTLLKRTAQEIAFGVDACRSGCRYFAVCGGGAPVNKMSENGSFKSAETVFCRLSVQSAADALAAFSSKR